MKPARHAFFALAFAASSVAAPPDDGLRFDSPRVVDLSSRVRELDTADVPIVALAPDAEAAILAVPALAEGDPSLPFASDALHCADDARCAAQAEARLIDAEHGLVTRDGGTLRIAPPHGTPLRFVDYAIKATRSADGDGARHRFLGRIANTGLLHVAIDFAHDSPGAFLIGADNGKVAFVHNGGDVAALSPGGGRIAVLNSLNAPAAVAIADLDAEGPSLALACRARAAGSRVVADAKGWRDPNGFDIVLKRTDADGKPQLLPLRLARDGGHWRVMARDTAAPAAFDDFSCRAPRQQF